MTKVEQYLKSSWVHPDLLTKETKSQKCDKHPHEDGSTAILSELCIHQKVESHNDNSLF
jgi:hypothetical protein